MSLFLKLGVAGIVAGTLACTARVASHEEAEDPSTPAVSTDEAVVHGGRDRGRHPAVVALVAREGDERWLCTAFAIARDVVVTARHCVARALVSEIECPARVPQVGRPLAAASIEIRLGDEARAAPPAARGRSIHAPYTDALCDADLALVTLDRELPVTPLRVARASRPHVGRRIVAVGYGKLGDRGSDGVRRFRTDVFVTAVTPTEIVVSESTCSGDSGGPAIDAETGEVLGVLSRGAASCEGPGARNVYVRIAPFFDLVDRIVPDTTSSPAPSANDVGETCASGATCASGICVAPGYCSRRCGAAFGRCPAGYRCARRIASPSSTVGVCAEPA